MDEYKMDNQQERFLDWFGGIVDGEGCLTFKSRWQRNKYIQISPVLIINNTSKLLIDECIKGLEELKIPHWVNVKHPPKNKSVYILEISGLKRFAKLLPYLRVRAKKDQVDILRRFTESRLQFKGKQKVPYTKKELEIVAEIAKIHTRKNPQRLYARLLQHQGE